MSKEFWERRGELRGILTVQPTATERTRAAEERLRRRLIPWTLRLIDRATREAERGEAPQIVDLGCGFGDFAVAFAARARHVLAVDYAASMVKRARETVAASGRTNVTVVQADLRQPFELPAAIDVVYIGAAAMYLADDDYVGLLRRLRARMRPGALLVEREYVALNGGPTGYRASGDYDSYRRAPADYLALARRAGFASAGVHTMSDLEVDRIAVALCFGSSIGMTLARPIKAMVRAALRGKREGSTTFLLRPAPEALSDQSIDAAVPIA